MDVRFLFQCKKRFSFSHRVQDFFDILTRIDSEKTVLFREYDEKLAINRKLNVEVIDSWEIREGEIIHHLDRAEILLGLNESYGAPCDPFLESVLKTVDQLWLVKLHVMSMNFVFIVGRHHIIHHLEEVRRVSREPG